jgi:hypothetical protein
VSNKIQCIKSLRWITGMGLKEAKDLAEASELRTVVFEEKSMDRSEGYNLDREIITIRSSGYDVVEISTLITTKIKALVVDAVNNNDYTLAKDLIDVLARRL